MKNNKKAMTLTELIIGIVISAIILLFLTNFMAITLEEFSYSNNHSKIIPKLYEIEEKISDYRKKYLSGSILIDNNSGVGTDILIFRTINGETNTGGVLISMINKKTMKIDTNNNIDIIGKKLLGIRKLSEYELNQIDSNNSYVYDMKFNNDEIINELFLKDFQVENYNNGKIFEANIWINILLENIGSKYSNFSSKNIKKFNINF